MEVLVLLLLLWVAAGTVVLWWGTRSSAPGSRRLVRTCARRVVVVGEPVEVSLWPVSRGLPEERGVERALRVVVVLDRSRLMGQGPGSSFERGRDLAAGFIRWGASPGCPIAFVAFDAAGVQTCPFTADGAELAEFVARVGPGADPDLAVGLREAGALLAAEGAEPVERRVLVLTAGDARPEVARAEAMRLRSSGIQVLALAVDEHADTDLLAGLVRQGDAFGSDAEELNRLYERFSCAGRSGGYRATVTETIDTRGFLVDRTGEPPAFACDLVRGELRWLLPFVGAHAGPKVAYRVVGVRPGWHRIARRPAELDLLGPSGDRFDSLSGPGPRLLVLPRLGWPLSFLLLNPLWWMLTSWLYRGPRRFGVDASPEPARLRVLEAPRVDPPSAPTGPSTTPALLIGVGFSGALVLRALRQRLDELGAAADALRWLWVDTGPGPRPSDAAARDPAFGRPPDADDCVALPETVRPLFDRAASETRPPHLAWLDAELELERLRTADLDLAEGTHGRRALARAALQQHLEQEEPRLVDLLDDRLQELADGFRVVCVANASGGTGGGMTSDLLALVRARCDRLEREPSSVELLLLTHRAVGGSSAWSEAQLRAGRAFAAELGRQLVSPQRPGPLPPGASPGHDGKPRPHRIADRVLLAEELVESTPALERWPAASAHAAAIVLLQRLCEGAGGLSGSLDEQRGTLRGAEQASGCATVIGVGATWRELPLVDLGDYLASRAVFDFLAGELLHVEEVEGGCFSPLRSDALLRGARRRVERFTSDEVGLRRPAPAVVEEIPELAAAETAAVAVARVLDDLDTYPGTADVPTEVDSDALRAEVIDEQMHLFAARLEEWAHGILHGAPDEEERVAIERSAGLLRLTLAVEELDKALSGAMKSLRGAEASVPVRRVPRHRLAVALVARYLQCVAGYRQHLETWWRLMVGDASRRHDPERPPALLPRARDAVVRARTRLDERRRRFGGCVADDVSLDEPLAAEHLTPTVERLRAHVVWLPRSDAGPPRLTLRVQGAATVAFRAGAADAVELLATLRRTAFDLGIAAVRREVLDRRVDVASWLAGRRRDGIELASGAAAESGIGTPSTREFAVVPRGVSVVDSRADVEVSTYDTPGLATIVRVSSPCALLDTALVGDYERRLSGPSRQELPFVQGIDREAARYEGLFQRYGMARRSLTDLVRSYFGSVPCLRDLLVGLATGSIQRRVGEEDEVLSLGSVPLTREPRQTQEPLLLEALARLARPGGGATEAETAALASFRRELARCDVEELRRRARGLDSTLAPHLDGCPPRVRRDLESLTRLFLELELEARDGGAGGRA